MKRKEYPRPQFVRKNWQNLNGEWNFVFDDKNEGIANQYFNHPEVYDQKIQVPFVYQAEESGIKNLTAHDVVWYYRTFEVARSASQRVILHFGAVDYESDIFVNGQHVKNHVGGHTSFSVDVTDYLADSEIQTLSVRAFDPHADETIPRGKQSWEDYSKGLKYGIWYTDSTGIWQTVWLEVVEKTYIKRLNITPLYDDGKAAFEISLNQLPKFGLALDYEISFKGIMVAKGVTEITAVKTVFDVELMQEHIFRTNFHNDGWSWTPENPNLFDVTFRLHAENRILDEVQSYFGMRKVHTENGMVFLNNRPYYQKLVLDQGYWPTGLLTAPDDHDFVKDIELSKEMGFNGCRKHQKVSDPRFLYWADKMGYLVWGECAAATIYNFDATTRLLAEWKEIVERDYNHPSIITWTPLNESWGVPNIVHDRQQQHFSQTMYHYLHALDKTRLVVSNDGWALTETDICSIHNYNHGQKDEVEKYEYYKETLATRHNLVSLPGAPWKIFADHFDYQGQPILLTEFGGIAYDVSGQKGWGYTSVSNGADYLADYERVMKAVYASRGLWGYCYTQIYDVEQEINGLLTYDRKPKCDLAKIKAINEHWHVLNVE